MKNSPKKKLTPLPKLLKKAQEKVNRFVRERDKELGCISCGGPVQHAGHYFSQGHHSFLRFNPININGQCIKCNNYLHGNLIRYRQGLIERYGERVVLELESSSELQKTKKWSRDELEEIIIKYK